MNFACRTSICATLSGGLPCAYRSSGWIRLGAEEKAITVKGQGIRERYVAVDSSAAELGAWEDWGWVAFDEVHCSLYDMRAGMKDFSVYNLLTQKHYASDGTLRGGEREGDVMNIRHSD